MQTLQKHHHQAFLLKKKKKLGDGITEADGTITGSRLPTSRQVLRCLMYHYQQGIPENKTRTMAAKVVFAQVSIFYRKANIPMISDKKSCEKIIKLLDNNSKLRAIPTSRRSTASTLAKVQQHQLELDKTFQIWPPNAESLIKDPEDKQFLHSMETNRIATFGSKDKVLQVKLQRKVSRENAAQTRFEKSSQTRLSATVSSANMQISSSSEGSSNEGSSNESDDNFVPKTTAAAHKLKKTGTAAFISSNILAAPKIVAASTRMKITPAQQSALTQAFVEETGGIPEKVKLSYAHADRSRREVVKASSISSKHQWTPPSLASLHWDSKIMQSQTNKYVQEDRLVVAVGTNDEIKLLGAPTYASGGSGKTGVMVTQKITNLLSQWNCTNSVINMVFDTTSSNTGHLTGACVTIQNHLQRSLLWSGCRHHVGEIILTHVFNGLNVESTRSPEINIFSRFRKYFDMVPHTASPEQILCALDVSHLEGESKKLATAWKTETLSILALIEEFQRNDYEELSELCLVFLSGKEGINFKQPGAVHKARWMGKLIYAFKLSLLETAVLDLPTGTIATLSQARKIRRFVTFCSLLYCSWWFTCTSAVDAPYQDLKFYQNLILYEDIDSIISKSALTAFNRHLWYLTSEMVPLALFSNKTPAEDKHLLAQQLLTVKPNRTTHLPAHRFGAGFGKPKFPTNINQSTILANLVDEDSWFLFSLLQINTDFFELDVNKWKTTPSYKEALQSVKAINVVNDPAERAIKLSSDYLDTAKSEEHYQNVLQIVEEERKLIPNLRRPLKRKLSTT